MCVRRQTLDLERRNFLVAFGPFLVLTRTQRRLTLSAIPPRPPSSPPLPLLFLSSSPVDIAGHAPLITSPKCSVVRRSSPPPPTPETVIPFASKCVVGQREGLDWFRSRLGWNGFCRLDNICFSISGNRIKEKLGSPNNPVQESLSACVGSWEGIPIFFCFFCRCAFAVSPSKAFYSANHFSCYVFFYVYIYLL